MNGDQRGPWYLITGLILGLFLGLGYAWVVHPLEYVDTAPASLQPEFKDRYRAMIASAYTANGDLVRARARLELLNDPDIYRALAEQAQRTLAEGADSEEARALGILAIAMGQTNSSTSPTQASADSTAELLNTNIPQLTSMPPLTATIILTPTLTTTSSLVDELPTPSPTLPASVPTLQATAMATTLPEPLPSPTITETQSPTVTLVAPTQETSTPTSSPSPTPGGPFSLQSQEQVCEGGLDAPEVRVLAFDPGGQPVAGVEVIVTWENKEEHFFTGLKPELGLGYADYTLTPAVEYTLRLGNGGEPVTGLTALECRSSNGQPFWGAWLLKFAQN